MPDGTATAIVWEIAEYVAFIRNSTEFEMAYMNRLSNLTLGHSGSTVAGDVAALAPRRGKRNGSGTAHRRHRCW